jgi:histidine phosphotransferase ChpT
MNTEFDPKVVELLCARLCHDLIGPVAAINNGVELVTEFGDEMQGEAMGLIGESATKAADLIQLYRLAFGSARGSDGTGAGLEEARQRLLDALASDRISINWPASESGQYAGLARAAVKLVTNMTILAVEVLPGSGDVDVGIEPGQVEITAKKDGYSLDGGFAAIFDGSTALDDLTPRTIQAYFTCSLAEAAGTKLEVEAGEGLITLKANFPS